MLNSIHGGIMNSRQVMVIIGLAFFGHIVAMKRSGEELLSIVPKRQKEVNVFDAIDDNDFYSFTQHIATGTNPNKVDKRDSNNSRTPLLISMYLSDFTNKEKEQAYELLKEKGANIYVTTVNTYSGLLHLAADNGHDTFVKQLIQDGLSLETPDVDGSTPLFYAKNVKMARALLELGADINACNNKGQTVLFQEMGDEPGQTKKAKFFVINGIDCDACDDKGRTAYTYSLNKFDDAHADLKDQATANAKIIRPALVKTMDGDIFRVVRARQFGEKTQLIARSLLR